MDVNDQLTDADERRVRRIGDIERAFRSLPDAPRLRKGIGTFYELIVGFPHEVLHEGFADAVDVEMRFVPDDVEPIQLKLGPSMFDQYPIMLGPSLVWLCTPEIMGILEPHVRWEFYARGNGLLER